MCAESELNDGQGTRYVVTFQPQFPLPKPGEKRRRVNARAPKVNRSFHAHEKSSLGEFLEAAVYAVDRDETTLGFKIVGTALRTTKFTAVWTIPRTTFKDMQLASTQDYSEMVKQAMEKAKAEVKLEITECELASVSTVYLYYYFIH